MRTISVVVLIAFNWQLHAKELEAKQTTNTEDIEKLIDQLDSNELVGKVMNKLSDRLLEVLAPQDTDLDDTTLGKLAAPTSGVGTLPASRPVMVQGLANRREMAAGLALAPLVAIAGKAAAEPNQAYIDALLAKTKENKEKNDKSRKAQTAWNAKRWTINNYNTNFKDAKPDGLGSVWGEAGPKVARDEEVLRGLKR